MKNTNAMLLIDFYKAVHAEMLPKGITKSVSYYTPRMSRIKRWDKVVMFGLQGFIKNYLIDYFNEYFFNKPFAAVMLDYKRIMDASLGEDTYKIDKIIDLYKLGYLPIEIRALPEGTLVPMHCPMFCITNTHPDFAWLPQSLESLISAETWHQQLAATVGYTYRQIVNRYYDLTCDDNVAKARALGAFDFRGEECLESAVKAGAGWCLSFLNTATVPVIPYLEENYNCDCEKEPVAFGSPSTEHSVMCSNYAVDGDEITLLRRLLTEIYPNTSFSAVLDSYDYWNIIDNVLPQLKEEIMAHNGCMLMRGDSGDCVEVVTKTVFKLWEHFGGTVNSKGYKVLDPHVKAIYGDSITVQRCEEIYRILEENGFACSNVALGVGSFSFQCIEEDGELKPFTRDTFSSCIKATYCEINDAPMPIFKNPKDGGFKKSQRGCCVVFEHDSCEVLPGQYSAELGYVDGYTWDEACVDPRNLLETVFKDGEIIKEYTLQDIRNRLHGGAF
jgi:nicotinamide phosphoribosyltransferase